MRDNRAIKQMGTSQNEQDNAVAETVTVIFATHDGKRIPVAAPVGSSLMQAAIQHNVPGIEAECGGSCICATCHVYVEPSTLEHLPSPDSMEADMLECAAAERLPTSRLSCQIEVTAALEGSVITVPEMQF